MVNNPRKESQFAFCFPQCASTLFSSNETCCLYRAFCLCNVVSLQEKDLTQKKKKSNKINWTFNSNGFLFFKLASMLTIQLYIQFTHISIIIFFLYLLRNLLATKCNTNVITIQKITSGQSLIVQQTNNKAEILLLEKINVDQNGQNLYTRFIIFCSMDGHVLMSLFLHLQSYSYQLAADLIKLYLHKYFSMLFSLPRPNLGQTWLILL